MEDYTLDTFHFAHLFTTLHLSFVLHVRRNLVAHTELPVAVGEFNLWNASDRWIPSPTLGSFKCFLLAYVKYRWLVELQFVSAVRFNHVATCLVSPTQFSKKSSNSQQEEQPQPLHHGQAFEKQPKIITCTPITQNTQPNGQVWLMINQPPLPQPTNQPAQKTTINHHLPAIDQHSTNQQPAFTKQCYWT